MTHLKQAFIIDDSESYQQILHAHLSQLGYTVHSFFSVDECLDYKRQPDVILLDQNLANGKVGTDYIDVLKSRMPQAPIIFISVDGNLSIVTKAIKMGAFDYIIKNEAAFVRLRTALDLVFTTKDKQKGNMIKRASIIIFISAILLLLTWFLLR